MNESFWLRLKALIGMMIGISSLTGLSLLAYQGRLGRLPGRVLFAAFVLITLASFYFVICRCFARIQAFERLVLALSAILFTYASATAFAYFFQDWLLFAPIPGSFSKCDKLRSLGFEAIDTNFDGNRFRAYVHHDAQAKAWLILYHGQAESACTAVSYTQRFVGLPLNYAVVEYPGYVGDAERLSEAGYLRNAEAAYSYVAKSSAKMPIFLLGRSLGTGLASYVASRRAVNGLILVSPYTSIAELAPLAFPLLPIQMLNHNNLNSEQWATQVNAPALVIHGSNDKLIPVTMGRKISKAFPHLFQYVEIQGASHYSLVEDATSVAWERARYFISERLKTTSTQP